MDDVIKVIIREVAIQCKATIYAEKIFDQHVIYYGSISIGSVRVEDNKLIVEVSKSLDQKTNKIKLLPMNKSGMSRGIKYEFDIADPEFDVSWISNRIKGAINGNPSYTIKQQKPQ